MANVVVGIDLGTTYSCVGICRNKKVEIIHNELGNRTTPSYVAFTDDGLRLIGDDAKNQLIRNPKNTIFNIKRLMGRNWDDDVVQNEIKNFPFEVVERNTRPHVKIAREKKGERYFSAEQISAVILRKMVKTAESFLNEKIKNVVITVPAYFNDAQRQATKNAGSIAGLNVLRILNEPTAAAVAYGLNTLQGNKTILVFDLGGGTLDVSILKIENTTFTVLATCGNTHLGGEDFDQNVVNHFIKLYMQKKRKDASKDNRAVQKLRREVEKAKKVLTFALSSQIDIDGFFEGEDFSEMLTKAKFENLNKDLFSSTLEPIAQALKDAKLQKNDIDEIVMVGGSSRIPKIRELITEFFDGKQPFVKINPDEAIAYGAAIETGILSGQQDSVVLNDVNPLSLGIEMSSKMMKIFIPRNTVIPVKKSYNLTTAYDYQTEGLFSIYEGELPVAKDNLLLGEFLLSNITEARRGVPVIKTTFEIDENGLLHVSAEDSVTKERRDICIDYAKNRPTLEEINAMIKISEEYDKLDGKYNDSVTSRIEFSERLYWLRNNLDEKTLSIHTKEFLKEFIDDNLKWLEEVKICDVKEYRERQEKFEDTLNLIENK